MKYCLWCREEIFLEIIWANVFFMNQREKLCKHCKQQLEKITGNLCEICGRQSEIKMCSDCLQWKKIFGISKDPLTKNISLYSYNHFMKEVIAKWKYRGDYVLSEIFQEPFVANFHKNYVSLSKRALIVPIPLSKERIQERGFNQAAVLAGFLTRNVTECLKRIHSEKQSKKSKVERMATQNPFQLKNPINKPVILVDDIYTTGITIRHAANLLIRNGCPNVYSYTLVRG